MAHQGKIEPRFYKVRVQTHEGRAHHIVVSYNLDIPRTTIGFEFYRIVSNMPIVPFGIPTNRPATFREELLVLDQAFNKARAPRSEECDLIHGFLKEAYGKDAEIGSIELIEEYAAASA